MDFVCTKSCIKFYSVFIKPGDNAVEYSENHLICLTFLSYLPSHEMPCLLMDQLLRQLLHAGLVMTERNPQNVATSDQTITIRKD
jgi:hypothetical protein